jgi:hypothetical protein
MRPERSQKTPNKRAPKEAAVEPAAVSPLVAGAGLLLGGGVAKALAGLDPTGSGELSIAHAAVLAAIALLAVVAAVIGSRGGRRAAAWLVLAFQIGMIGFAAFSVTSRVVDRAEVVMENPIA